MSVSSATKIPLLLLLLLLLLLGASPPPAMAFAVPPSSAATATPSPNARPSPPSAEEDGDDDGPAATTPSHREDEDGPFVPAGRPWDVARYQSRHAFVWEKGSSLVGLLDVRPGETVLDVGCGSGELTHAVAASAEGVRAIGMDADAGMVERAREQFPGVEFFVGDVRSFDVDEPVDALFSNAALHWVPPRDVDRAAARMAHALKSGGRFVAEFGGRGNVQRIVEAVAEAVPGVEPPWHFPSVAEYATVLEANGIEVLSASLYDRPTRLEDKEDGIKDWLRMFGSSFFEGMGEGEVEEALDRIQAALRPRLHDGTGWIADYRRLRIVGRKL